MNSRLWTLATILLAAGPAVAQADYTGEDWNDPGLQANGWFYWNENNGQAWPDHDVVMDWKTNGGIGNSGHVHTGLGMLTPQHDETRAYYPAYNTTYLTPPHYIDLTVPHAAIQVWLSDMTQPFTPNIDFHGGMLTIFLGQWTGTTPRSPTTMNGRSFITSTASPPPISRTTGPGNPRWRQFTFPIGEDSDWAVLDLSDNPPVTQASELLHWPQQWGFTILDQSGPPTGALAFDNFGIVPEPATLVLLGLCLLLASGKRGAAPILPQSR